MSLLTQLSHHVQPYFTIFSFQFYYYGLLMATGIFLIYYFAKKNSHHYNLDPQSLDSLFLWIFVPSIIGARLYHVFSEFAYYLENPILILNLRSGGLGIYGALAGAFLGLWLATKRYNLSFINAANLTAPYILLAQGIVRWGNFLNQEAFGPPTESYFKIYIEPRYRPYEYLAYDYFHPTFFYESILNLTGAAILIFLQHKSNYKTPTFALYLIFYGLIRLISESFRFDTAQIGDFQFANAISISIILIGIWLYLRRQNKQTSGSPL